jgi:hypothetical protein
LHKEVFTVDARAELVKKERRDALHSGLSEFFKLLEFTS